MNKRYIDFVPAKDGKKPAAQAKQGVKPAVKSAIKPVARSAVKEASKPVVKTVAKPAARTMAEKKKSQESPRIIYTAMPTLKQRTTKAKETPKVSFSTSTTRGKSEPMLGVVEDVNPAGAGVKPTASAYKAPNSPFINRAPVAKRPLSKNVYQKKTEAVVTEKAKGPVTIIAKPEKDAHVSVIVTIILTIILGAAAGTVAFLLLPK